GESGTCESNTAGLLLFNGHRDAEGRRGGLVLLRVVVDRRDLLLRPGVLPDRRVQPDAGPDLLRSHVLAFPGDLAAARLLLPVHVEPVAHILAVHDWDDDGTAVLEVDAVLPDGRSVLDEQLVARHRLVGAAPESRRVEDVQFGKRPPHLDA